MDGMGYMISNSPRTLLRRWSPWPPKIVSSSRKDWNRNMSSKTKIPWPTCDVCIVLYSFVLFCCGCLVFYFFAVIYTHLHLLYANLTKCPDKWINQYIHIRSYYIRFPPWFGNWMVLCVTTCLGQMCWMRRFLSPTIWKFQLAWLSACSP